MYFTDSMALYFVMDVDDGEEWKTCNAVALRHSTICVYSDAYTSV